MNDPDRARLEYLERRMDLLTGIVIVLAVLFGANWVGFFRGLIFGLLVLIPILLLTNSQATEWFRNFGRRFSLRFTKPPQDETTAKSAATESKTV